MASPSSSVSLAVKAFAGYDPCATAGDCIFNEDAAAYALEFFERCLTHVKGKLAGQPFVLEPWEEDIIINLFGWLRPDGTRRYREAFIFVPRKNGKSTLAAGICNFVTFADDEPGAEVYCAASDRPQAALLFDTAKGMIEANEQLSSMCEVLRKSVELAETRSTFRVLSGDVKNKDGFNTHCAVIDELHAQPNRVLVDLLETSMGAREQPLLIHITTAGWDKQSICWEKYHYACGVRDGSVDPHAPNAIDDESFLPVIYEALPEDDWTDPETWRKANPNLGVTPSLDYMERKCKRAKISPAFENTFKRLHLNLWTEQSTVWLPMNDWALCTGESEFKAKEKCWAGLDLSTVNDLTAFVAVQARGAEVHTWLHFWCPRDGAEERERREGAPYLTWERQGYMTLTDGKTIDYAFVRKEIVKFSKEHSLVDVGFDPYNATHLAGELLEQNGIQMVQFRQGFLSMNEPSKELLRLVLDGSLRHGGNPVLSWMAAHCAAKIDPAGNIKPDKAASADRIDGIVALIMAIGRMMASANKGLSVYSKRGIRIL